MAEAAARVILVVGPPGRATADARRWLEALGAPVLPEGELLGARNDLLRAVGATEAAPPELDRWDVATPADGPEALAGPFERIDEALAPYADGVVAWVEPANAVLLPLLRRGLGDRLAGVVVAWSRPEATVDALAADGLSAPHALALWEAFLVHALRGAAELRLVGVDTDQPDAGAGLEKLLEDVGVDVAHGAVLAPVEIEPRPSLDDVDATDVARAADAIAERLAPALAAASGFHASWAPESSATLSPTAETILSALRAAHRSALDAVTAWAAVHDAELAAKDAKLAVEADHRAIVGPDPLHYLELRRELWRVRDDFAGLVAERAHFRTEWMRADAKRLTVEQRIADLFDRLHQLEAERDRLRVERDAVTRERDEMLGSERWRIGGLLLEPMRRLRSRSRAN